MILKHHLLKLISKRQVVTCGSYHSPSQFDQYFFDDLDKALDVYSTYENILITGDFNAQEGEKCLDIFLYQHELKSLNKEATCYKNPNKPRCIDLILTNSPSSFFNIEIYFTVFTGLSDCQKLIFLKQHSLKQDLKK